jgi:hypothetical protein
MSNENRNEKGGLGDYAVNFTIDKPKSLTGNKPIMVSYGKPSLKPADVDYDYEPDKPNGDNQIHVFAPVKGHIQFDSGTIVLGLATGTPPKITLHLQDYTGISYNRSISDINGFFVIDEDEYGVSFEFNEDWNTIIDAAKLYPSSVAFFEMTFTLDIESAGVTQQKTFTIKSNSDPAATFYTSNSETVFVPTLQIYAEQHVTPVPAEYSGALSAPKAASGASQIVCGNPVDVTDQPDYNYANVIANDDNNIGLFIPLSGGIAFDNSHYPHGEILGLDTEKACTLFLTLPGDIGEVSYNHNAEEIAQFFTVSDDKSGILFDFNNDWNRTLNVAALNKAGEGTLSGHFSIRVKITDHEGAIPQEISMPITIGGAGDGDIALTLPVPKIKITAEPTHFVPVNTNPSAITDIGVIEQDDPLVPTKDQYGYTVIKVDLNASAGGKWLFLKYKKGEPGDYSNAIYALAVTNRSDNDETAPDKSNGWKRIGVDLNEGAGGNYIYLWYKRGNPPNGEIISDIDVIMSDNSFGDDEYYGMTVIKSDLNATVKGKYVYVCYNTKNF